MHKILIQHKDYDPSIEVDVNKVVNILYCTVNLTAQAVDNI